MHHVTDKFFDFAKKRYTFLKDSDIDERFIEIVRDFNKIDGVVSMWCCSGHTPLEILQNDKLYEGKHIKGVLNKNSDIIFVMRKDVSIDIINKISNYFDSQDSKFNLKYRPHTNLFKLVAPTKVLDFEFMYNAVQIVLKTNFGEDDFTVYDVWNDLIDNLLMENV